MAITPQEKRKYIEKGKAQVEEGLPGWFATFADMMTLLLAFFVLLAAISTIDPVKLQEMADAMGKKVGKTKKEGKAMNLADVKAAVVQMMEENQELKEDVEVYTSKKGVTISISDKISFKSGSADLQPGILDVLSKLVPTINAPGNQFPIIIEGHTDSDQITGRIAESFPTNWELSAARAAAVVRKLIELNVSPLRLEATGLAEFSPREQPTSTLIDRKWIRDHNLTPEMKAKNRRVEIIFKGTDSGLEILKKRFANGEISLEQFKQMENELLSGSE